jgi:cephalosporin-C deacetylase-like acetyl esterase
MEQRVEFTSEGEQIVGTLFRPDGADGPLPTMVAAGGWCYTKEIVLPHVARIVNESGVQVLAFDYRGFGESEGSRRQHLDPWMQIRDYQNALTWLERQDGVDADRLGAFGISYSGGHVLILAAIDPRVKAIVSVVPVIDGYPNMRRVHGETRFRQLEEAVLSDLRARVDGNGGVIPMSSLTPTTELSVWPFPRIHEVFHQIRDAEAPLHEHWSTMESVELLMRYDVHPYLPRILNTAVMMIVAEGDNITPWDLEIGAFDQLRCPQKQLEILPSVSHMSLYSDRPDTNVAAAHAADWFSEHLGVSASRIA